MARRGGEFGRPFGASFWAFAALAVAGGATCYALLGGEAFRDSLREDLDLVLLLLPKLVAAMLIAGFAQALLPKDKVAAWMGESAGLRGVALAAGAGVVTPGGPMTSFPLVNALQDAGTGRSALIAYVTSWSVLGFQRIVMWELPLMGPEFAALRFLSSLPLPFVAGLVSRLLPPTPVSPTPDLKPEPDVSSAPRPAE